MINAIATKLSLAVLTFIRNLLLPKIKITVPITVASQIYLLRTPKLPAAKP